MTYIALLRGINVGGHNLVPMSGLRDLFGALGFSKCQTLLQSGNTIFDCEERASAELESLLEVETEKRFKTRVDYFIRTPKEWKEICRRNPFPKQAKSDPGHLIVAFLKSAPGPQAVKLLESAIRGPEFLKAIGRHLYIVYPDGMGRSKLTWNMIETKLGTRGTGRNWNTVQKLLALASG